MKHIPILFSTEMVKAILDGRKTMTRRVVKPQPIDNREVDGNFFEGNHKGYVKVDGHPNWREQVAYEFAKWQPGDILEPAMYIPGCDRNYCAGINGNIWSRAKGDWKKLKIWRNQKGYAVVTIMEGGKKKTRHVHSLVCSAFHGERPENAQVRHLDGESENNHANNLKWGSQYENWQDRKAHGNGIEGEKHHSSILTDEERSHINWAIQKGLCSQRHAAKVLGISQYSIYGACHPERLITPTLEPAPECKPIWLEVTEVRVERLQEISEEDALDEGVNSIHHGDGAYYYHAFRSEAHPENWVCQIDAFKDLWQSINGLESWEANPWVWCISFKVLSTTGKPNQ